MTIENGSIDAELCRAAGHYFDDSVDGGGRGACIHCGYRGPNETRKDKWKTKDTAAGGVTAPVRQAICAAIALNDEQRAWLEYYARRLGRPAEDLISQALAFEIEEHVWDHELEEKTGVLWCDDAERNALTAELDNRGN